MTIRHQTACCIITALIPVSVPRLAEAQTHCYYRSDTTPSASRTHGVMLGQEPPKEAGPGFKSERTALLLSLLGTAIPAGVAIASASGELLFAAVVFGPSLGHLYAERPGRALAGVGIRLALVGVGAGIAVAGDKDDVALFLATLALGGMAVVWDIARAPRSARIHNDKLRPGRIAVALLPLLHAPGVQLNARISF